ncbi:hypothetical protein DLM75_17035 [Leptospira stimsonii]|uniref:Uncharacterized protein n=1 Tax=Leptospira stimsonii TaxID=2202203 RepID=A0A396YZB9_9LEPT|nr:hypothetical protein DLM75_17035 [Leptospira stimsonii]
MELIQDKKKKKFRFRFFHLIPIRKCYGFKSGRILNQPLFRVFCSKKNNPQRRSKKFQGIMPDCLFRFMNVENRVPLLLYFLFLSRRSTFPRPQNFRDSIHTIWIQEGGDQKLFVNRTPDIQSNRLLWATSLKRTNMHIHNLLGQI